MDREEAIQTLNENSKEWLAAILKNEGKGFGEEIVDFDPEPGEDNNYLWNDDTETFNGKIMTDNGAVFEFTIGKEGEEWYSSTKMITDEEGTEIVTEEEETELTETVDGHDDLEEIVPESGEDEVEMMKKEIARLKEMIPEDVEPEPEPEPDEEDEDEEEKILKNELMELRKEVSRYKETVRKDKEKAVRTFCECLYEDGRMTEGYYPQDDLGNLLIAILGVELEGPLTYSEKGKEASVFDGVKTLLSKLPKSVEFSESTTRQIDAPLLKEEIPTVFGEVDEKSGKEYMKIKKYMKDNGISNFLEAKRKMSQGY